MRKILLTFLTTLLCSVTAWGTETEIIKVVLSDDKGSTQTVTGSIGGTSSVNSLGNSKGAYKLNSGGAYVSLTLSTGYFDAYDCLELDGSKAMQIYYGTPGSDTLLLTTAGPTEGKIRVRLLGLPANQNTIYVYRASDTYNGTLTYMSVKRPETFSTTGTGDIFFSLSKGSAAVNGIMDGDEANIITTVSTTSAFSTSTLAIGSNNSKDGYCGQITGQTADYNASNYVQLGFTIADGYTFAPSAADLTIFANSTSDMKTKVVISDGVTTIESNDLACSSSADSKVTFTSGAFTDKTLSGDVTITIYQWGVASKRAYIKSPVTISGTIAAAGDTYSITYNCNGAESGCPSNVASATTLPNPLPTGLTKSGYALEGWYTNEGLTTPAVAGATLAANTTLYAKWVTAYTLTWNLNGGTVTTAGTGAAVDATGTPSIALVAGAAITTPVVAKDYHTFNAWSSTPASTMPAGNTTYTASWTHLYAFGTYTFENNASAGTAPNRLTLTDDNKSVAVAAGSRVDNIFFSAQNIAYESGVYVSGDNDYYGWKIKTADATISFLVENDCNVTFGVGTINGAVVSYTNQSGTPVNNSALTAKTDNTFSVKGGTVVTFKTTTASTNTLKKIAITAACTSHSVTATTSTGNNTYGTVSAASASVCEGSTTTVTATPATGYQVTNWAVSGTDASVSPSGASNSNTTTLTMGTADATVTVTFGCVAPTSPDITGTTAYTAGQDISLTASATGISASVTYTWYKGTDWATASATSSIHSGATLSIDDCVEGDAGTYWCNISNGTGCDVQTSKTITVSGACTDPGLTITLN